jgi:hypothetical protein
LKKLAAEKLRLEGDVLPPSIKLQNMKQRHSTARVLTAVPALFNLAMIVFYSIVIFWMNDAMEHNSWKVAVALFALVIKIAREQAST